MINKKLKKERSAFILLIFILFNLTSCKKLVNVEAPYTSINAENVFKDDNTAIGAMTSIYTKLSASNLSSGMLTSISLLTGLSADELTLYSGITDEILLAYYQNRLTKSNTGSNDFWVNIYPIIYISNSVIEGVTASNTLTPSVRSQLLGEALFIRSLCYFYLTNLYGDAALALSTDYKLNANLDRSNKTEVYKQIISDLKDAKELLSDSYLDKSLINSTDERVRPNKWAASSLLARVYLMTADYTNAETEASIIINNSLLFNLVEDLDGVFLKNSTEAIWQLQPVNIGWNTEDAKLFIIPTTGPNGSNPVYLSNALINSFEPGDERRIKWIDSVNAEDVTYYYPYKYKNGTIDAPITEYSTVFRLAEQYLIRSEARVELGILTGNAGALDDLNLIRNRAGLKLYDGNIDKNSLISAILHERRMEFFSEWGHRWIDLKRTMIIDEVMSIETIQKGGIWNTNDQLYPIPLTELQKSPGMSQNPGY